ncbi:MAG: hypothetical protein CM15mP108_0540 [Gammaproteobacteria bacterium]|nr:MAG: hypothetical protein CM15mP108_0540 [Gammaproteobacteria bacterium]
MNLKNLINKVQINFPECNIIHNTTASITETYLDLKKFSIAFN